MMESSCDVFLREVGSFTVYTLEGLHTSAGRPILL